MLRRATPLAFVTPALVVVNVAVFVLMIAKGVSPASPTTGDLFAWGADYGPAVVAGGEWWRLLTSAFVHIGFVHLALNMYVLWGVGNLAERVYGNGAFLFLYLVAAVGGSLISTIWSPLVVSAGASGAVFGVYGAILAFTAFSRDGLPEPVTASLQKGALSFIAYNVLFGLTVPAISNSAHLGGLGAGFLAGWLLRRDLTTLDDPVATGRTLRGAVCLPVLAGLAWAVDVRVSSLPSVKAMRLADEALAIGEKDPAGARRKLDQAIAADPRNHMLYLSRGRVRVGAGEREGAIADFGEAIRLAPRSPEALAARCTAFYQANDYVRATKDCDAALAIDAASTEAWHRRAEIHYAQGHRPQALKAARRLTELAPQWAHARVLVAKIQMASGDVVGAESELENARKAAPDDREIAAARIGLLRHRGDQEGARELADRVVSDTPQDPGAYVLRAQVHQAMGDDDRALADIERAIALHPTDPSTHNSRAWLLLKLGRFADGLEAVERSLALKPADPYATGTRCWLRASLGDEAGARLDCRHASRLLPGSLLDRLMLHFLEGRPAEAAAAWREQGTQDPEDVPLVAPWLAKTETGVPSGSSARPHKSR